VQEILVRIQYPTRPQGQPVLSLIGDTSVSTEAAVTGVMGASMTGASMTDASMTGTSMTTAAATESVTNPYFQPADDEETETNLNGGKKLMNKKKTLRKKHIYFTKDDFIAF
jgi:hypothetical protein